MFRGWSLWSYSWLRPIPLTVCLHQGPHYTFVTAALAHHCLLLLVPPSYSLPSKRSFKNTKLLAALSKCFNSSQHWRMKTLQGHSMSFIPWPHFAFLDHLLPPPYTWTPVILRFLMWWDTLPTPPLPLTLAISLLLLRLFLLPIVPPSPCSTRWNPANQISPSSYDVFPVTHPHPGWQPPFHCIPVALFMCDCYPLHSIIFLIADQTSWTVALVLAPVWKCDICLGAECMTRI